MINYGSYGGLFENEDFRVYVTADSVDDIIDIFSDISRVMEPTITNDEIREIIEDVKEYGDSDVIIGKLSGYVTQTELMLDM